MEININLNDLSYKEYLHFLNVIIEYFNMMFDEGLDIYCTVNPNKKEKNV